MATILKVLLVLVVVVLGANAINMLVVPYLPASLQVQKSSIENSVVENAKKSVVVLQTPSPGIRSGAVLNEDGLVVTLHNLLKQKNVIPGYIAGDSLSLKNLHMGSDNLALLRMTKNGLVAAKLADKTKIKAGQEVFLVAVVSFDRNEWPVKEGLITQASDEIIKTNIEGGDEIVSAPLFNMAGELVGIVYLDSNGRIVAIPVGKIKSLAGL